MCDNRKPFSREPPPTHNPSLQSSINSPTLTHPSRTEQTQPCVSTPDNELYRLSCTLYSSAFIANSLPINSFGVLPHILHDCSYQLFHAIHRIMSMAMNEEDHQAHNPLSKCHKSRMFIGLQPKSSIPSFCLCPREQEKVLTSIFKMVLLLFSVPS